MSGGRPILAARTSSGDASKDGNNSPGSNRNNNPSSSRPKRTLIESACSACRRRKSRCDGVRPTCSRCQNLRTECQYEAEEGESRWSALRRRNQILEAERDQLRELMAFVQTRTEPEAQDIFMRIRQCNYDDLFLLLRQIKEGAMGMQTQLGGPLQLPVTGSPGMVDQRLPPIQTILDVPGHGLTPAHLVQQQSMSSDSSAEMSTMPSAHHPHRSVLDTLEPSLRAHPPQMGLSLSSEESTSSIGSTTMELQHHQRPYRTP